MIPAGVTTATVHLDAPVSFTGDPGRIHIIIAPSVPLVWTATGTPMGNFIDTISLNPGVDLDLQLPHTDQPGFEDGFGNAYTGWYYTVTVVYEKDGQRIDFPAKDFQVPSGQGDVDLALIPAGEAAPVPEVAPILPVTSWAGRTGAVVPVKADVGLGNVNNTSDADKPVSVLQQLALDAKLDDSQLGAASGVAPLDSGSRVPQVNLPAHLDPVSLSATYATPAAITAAVAPVAADVATKAKVSSIVRPSAAFRTSNPNRTMLTTFQAGHGFTQAVTSSFNYNDTTDYALGKQSAYIVTNGTGGQAILTKSAAVTLDMTGKVFALLLKVTNVAHLNRITMLAGSGGFANNFQIQLQASNALPNQEITPEGRWIWVTLPWNPSTTGGTPARNNITDLRVAVVDDNTGNPVKVQLQAIATQPERVAYPNGVVSIGFDDNWGSQSTTAIPYIERYGFQPTVYTIVDLVGTAGRQSLSELKRIEEYSGGEIAAHSWSSATHTAGFTGVSTDTLDTELRLMKEWLIDNGFQGRELLAYPLGNFNGAVMDIAAKYYKFARTVNIRQQETQPPGNPYTCRAQSSTNTVTLAQITAQVDAAYANGTWLNLLYHDIVPTPGAASASVQVTQANFEAAMDYIAGKGIPVRTVSQVLKATAP